MRQMPMLCKEEVIIEDGEEQRNQSGWMKRSYTETLQGRWMTQWKAYFRPKTTTQTYFKSVVG